MDFEKIMENLTRELEKVLKEMSKAKTIEDKKQYSHIVKNLCQSMGVFLNLASELSSFEFEEE